MRGNILAMKKKHGVSRLLAITLTCRNAVSERTAEAKFRRLRKLLPTSAEWVSVLHCNGEGGRIHFHLCSALDKDALLKQTQDSWRRMATKAGFGRILCDQVKSSSAYGRYMSQGVTESRGMLPRGTRFFRCSRPAQRFTVKFCWVAAGRPLRKYIVLRAAELGVNDDAGFRRLLGKRWGQRLWWAFDANRGAKAVSYSHRRKLLSRRDALASRELTETGKVVVIT